VPGAYEVDPVHSFLAFRVRHLVVGRVDGRFTAFGGQFTVNDDNPGLLDDVEVTIDASSIDTGVAMRDEGLRSPRFLEIDRFPLITIRGQGGRHAGGAHCSIEAELTLHGVSRAVFLDVQVRGMTTDANGKAKAALSANAAIRRVDFDLITELQQESGEIGTGTDVEIQADLEAFLRS
jgi:polyisoprenoid-binding protein YceI